MSINTETRRAESVRLQDYLSSPKTAPEEQLEVIQEVFKQMATLDKNGKVKVSEDLTFKKLNKDDYKALANAASQCLKTQSMSQREVKQFHQAMNLAIDPSHRKYFAEAEEMADFRELAASRSPEDVLNIYNHHIEKLVKIKNERAEELKKPIKRGKIIVGIAAATGVVLGLLIGAGLAGGLGAVSLGLGLSIGLPLGILLGTVLATGLAFGFGGLARNIVLAKPEKELKEIKVTWEELENEQKILKEGAFLEFLRDNHITPNEINIPISVKLFQEDKKLKHLEAEKEALKEKEIEAVKQKMDQLRATLR